MDRFLKPRVVFAGIFIACTALIAYALYMQHALGLEPCPMCILQRYAFFMVGFVALAGAIHGPARVGTWIYGVGVILFSVLGGGVAIRHSWLQHFPNPQKSCGVDLEYLLELPLSSGFPAIFRGR